MNKSIEKTIGSIIDEVFREYKNINLSFTNSRYWETLALTYIRTLNDINDIVKTKFKNKPKIKILEIGSFSGILATLLKRSNNNFEVTALDLPLFMYDEVLISHYKKEGIHGANGNLATLPLNYPNMPMTLLFVVR